MEKIRRFFEVIEFKLVELLLSEFRIPLYFIAHNDFKKYIIYEEINNDNLRKYTGNNYLIPKLKSPKDKIPHPINLGKYTNFTYRLISLPINSDEKGSTFLSSLLIKIIYNIFGKNDITLETCKTFISSEEFDLDEDNKKNNFFIGLEVFMVIKHQLKKKLIILHINFISLNLNQKNKNFQQNLK